MRNVNLYRGGGRSPLGGQVARIPSYAAKPDDIITAKSAWASFGADMVRALTAKAEKNKEDKIRSSMLAAMIGDKYQHDPNKASESFTPSEYIESQRVALADAQAQAQPEDALFEGAFVDNIGRPNPKQWTPLETEIDRGVDALGLGPADPADDAAMRAALIGDIKTPLGYAGDRGGLPASTEAEELAAWAGSPEEMAAQERDYRATVNTPGAEEARMAEAVRLNPEIANTAEYAQWVQSNLARKQALVDEQRKHELDLELKRTGPATAGAKPGTPYEVNGRMVQDYIDASGNWAKRDVGAAAEFQYSSRPGVALQYEKALTDLKAGIRAEETRDPNSPQLPILRERLTDLESTIAKSLSYIGSAANVKALEGARGETQEEREANMRGIRRGIQTKHDRLPILQSNIDEMKELSGRFWTSGSLGAIASFFPESAQYELDERKKNIASAVGLQELIDVKAQGATFGSLTENEMELLISSVGNLNTLLKPEVLGETLDNIIRLYAKGLAASKGEFAELYPDVERTWETKENVIKFDSDGNIIE
jgi:hypothetical protein